MFTKRKGCGLEGGGTPERKLKEIRNRISLLWGSVRERGMSTTTEKDKGDEKKKEQLTEDSRRLWRRHKGRGHRVEKQKRK